MMLLFALVESLWNHNGKFPCQKELARKKLQKGTWLRVALLGNSAPHWLWACVIATATAALCLEAQDPH
jgi:hypothetical protein